MAIGTTATAIIAGAMALAGTATSMYSANQQAQAQQQQQDYERQMLQRNATIAEQQAKMTEDEGRDAKREAHDEAQRTRLEAARRVSEQRSALSASGAALDEGSTLDMNLDTVERGELDAMRHVEQGERQDYQQRQQAWNLRNQSSALLSKASTLNAPTSEGFSYLKAASGAGNYFLDSIGFRADGKVKAQKEK